MSDDQEPSVLIELVGEHPALKSHRHLYSLLRDYINDRVADKFSSVAQKVKQDADLTIRLNKVFSRDDVRDLAVMLLDGFLELLTQPQEDGTNEPDSVTLPGGHGSFQLYVAKKTRNITPQGIMLTKPKRWRVRYHPGKVVRDRVSALVPPVPDEETSENPPAG